MIPVCDEFSFEDFWPATVVGVQLFWSQFPTIVSYHSFLFQFFMSIVHLRKLFESSNFPVWWLRRRKGEYYIQVHNDACLISDSVTAASFHSLLSPLALQHIVPPRWRMVAGRAGDRSGVGGAIWHLHRCSCTHDMMMIATMEVMMMTMKIGVHLTPSSLLLHNHYDDKGGGVWCL